MAVDLNAGADAIIALLKTFTGLADEAGTIHVHKGVPASLPARLSVYVALADLQIVEKATQLQSVNPTYAVNFGYRVEANTTGASATAETALMTAVVEFVQAMRLPANRPLGSVSSVSGSAPQYQIVAGSEFRVFGLLVTSSQSQTF